MERLSRLVKFILPLTMLAALLVGAVVSAQVATQLTLRFQPSKDRYGRGESINFVATLKDASGTPLAGKQVEFFKASSATRNQPRKIGEGTTDASGRATFPGTVPNSPNEDWVFISVRWAGDASSAPMQSQPKRIPIG